MWPRRISTGHSGCTCISVFIELIQGLRMILKSAVDWFDDSIFYLRILTLCFFVIPLLAHHIIFHYTIPVFLRFGAPLCDGSLPAVLRKTCAAVEVVWSKTIIHERDSSSKRHVLPSRLEQMHQTTGPVLTDFSSDPSFDPFFIALSGTKLLFSDDCIFGWMSINIFCFGEAAIWVLRNKRGGDFIWINFCSSLCVRDRSSVCYPTIFSAISRASPMTPFMTPCLEHKSFHFSQTCSPIHVSETILGRFLASHWTS